MPSTSARRECVRHCLTIAATKFRRTGAQPPRVYDSFRLCELDADQIVDEVIKTIDELLASYSGDQIEVHRHLRVLAQPDRHRRRRTTNHSSTDLGRHSRRSIRKTVALKFRRAQIHSRTGCRFHPSYWPANSNGSSTSTTRISRHSLLAWVCRISLPAVVWRTRDIDLDGVCNGAVQSTRLRLGSGASFKRSASRQIRCPRSKTQTNARLTDSFASRWPALAGARLITIVGDGAANNIGAGCSTKDRIALMVGTSGAMRVVFAGGPPDELAPALWSYRVSRERVVVGGALSDGGGLCQWFTESLNLDRAH